MPRLIKEESLETTWIWSLAGKLEHDTSIISEPPIRKPHHGVSLERIVGSRKDHRPGEVSLALHGYRLLDEISKDIRLQ